MWWSDPKVEKEQRELEQQLKGGGNVTGNLSDLTSSMARPGSNRNSTASLLARSPNRNGRASESFSPKRNAAGGSPKRPKTLIGGVNSTASSTVVSPKRKVVGGGNSNANSSANIHANPSRSSLQSAARFHAQSHTSLASDGGRDGNHVNIMSRNDSTFSSTKGKAAVGSGVGSVAGSPGKAALRNPAVPVSHKSESEKVIKKAEADLGNQRDDVENLRVRKITYAMMWKI
jgi:hypothetical protein